MENRAKSRILQYANSKKNYQAKSQILEEHDNHPNKKPV